MSDDGLWYCDPCMASLDDQGIAKPSDGCQPSDGSWKFNGSAWMHKCITGHFRVAENGRPPWFGVPQLKKISNDKSVAIPDCDDVPEEWL